MSDGDTRLLVVEDHAVVREGLRLLLERQPGLTVAGQAASLREALQSPAEPDVILADLILGDERGPAVVQALHAGFPGAAILVLTMVDSPADVEGSLAAGARGYLLKEAAAEQLVDAVRRVARGEEYLHPQLGVALARRRQQPGPLSPREREVLRLIAGGHTNAEIADRLGVARRTVETHRAHIFQKLSLRTRAELVRYASEAGLSEHS
ncbi:MAG TPA: response regulator transcription factor [Candidatus Acidoferrales bacterium]|nr:response regulator transcription factor [Candidatus Acidoferrales bacterium]